MAVVGQAATRGPIRAHGLPTNVPRWDDTNQHESDDFGAKPLIR